MSALQLVSLLCLVLPLRLRLLCGFLWQIMLGAAQGCKREGESDEEDHYTYGPVHQGDVLRLLDRHAANEGTKRYGRPRQYPYHTLYTTQQSVWHALLPKAVGVDVEKHHESPYRRPEQHSGPVPTCRGQEHDEATSNHECAYSHLAEGHVFAQRASRQGKRNHSHASRCIKKANLRIAYY